jgi:hypothetical protein
MSKTNGITTGSTSDGWVTPEGLTDEHVRDLRRSVMEEWAARGSRTEWPDGSEILKACTNVMDASRHPANVEMDRRRIARAINEARGFRVDAARDPYGPSDRWTDGQVAAFADAFAAQYKATWPAYMAEVRDALITSFVMREVLFRLDASERVSIRMIHSLHERISRRLIVAHRMADDGKWIGRIG